MPTTPEIAVIVSTFERPGHLARCLRSLANQTGVDGRFEIVVTDDGSQDGTPELVAQFAKQAEFAVHWVTQPQQGFRLARCRNNGVRVSQAAYLLFTDGDCIFPPDHLAQHLAGRKPGVARAGDCVRLEREPSEAIDDRAIDSGAFVSLADSKPRRRMRAAARKAKFYQLTGNPIRPKLIGANIAVWRSDFERVNGFDEAFVGWGCEDDDFARRLRKSGVKIQTILDRTYAYHLWHPPHETTPTDWRSGANVERLVRPTILSACLAGLRQREISELAVRVVNRRCRWFHWAWPNGAGANSSRPCELELLVLPGDGQFAGDAECRVVIAPEGVATPDKLKQQADLILTPPAPLRTADQLYSELDRALRDAA